MNIKTIVTSTRLPFLILTPVCVLLGVSVVVFEHQSVDLSLLILVLIGALSAHISVNTLNEYLDYKSGLDLKTKRTNFSGGSGALLKHPETLRSVLITGIVFFLITTLIGLYFISLHGLDIMPIGLLGLALVLSYTSWINKHPLLCLISPGLGFGLLMVVGTQFVLTGEYSLTSVLVSFIPFFLVNNLLLLNQYPDIKADIGAGRRHFPIVYGINQSNKVYALFALIAIILIVVYVALGYLPNLSLIALIPMPLAFLSLQGMVKHGQHIGSFQHYLGANVALTLLTPLLLALSLLV